MFRKTKKPKHTPNEWDKTKPWFYNFYGHEEAWVKRMTRRKDRHNAKHNVQRDRDDLANRDAKSTNGWISW